MIRNLVFAYVKFLKIILFVYVFTFGCAGASLLHGLFLSLWRTGFSLWWLLLLHSTGSRGMGFSSSQPAAPLSHQESSAYARFEMPVRYRSGAVDGQVGV